MKTFRIIITSLFIMIASYTKAQPMSYDAMSHNALFLTDRMAYTLGITSEAIIDDLYRINYDYICGVNDYLDDIARGYHNEYYEEICYERDLALQSLLGEYLWRRLITYDYFYRPIAFSNRRWRFIIYTHDVRTNYYYCRTPIYYHKHYTGGHFFHGMRDRISHGRTMNIVDRRNHNNGGVRDMRNHNNDNNHNNGRTMSSNGVINNNNTGRTLPNNNRDANNNDNGRPLPNINTGRTISTNGVINNNHRDNNGGVNNERGNINVPNNHPINRDVNTTVNNERSGNNNEVINNNTQDTRINLGRSIDRGSSSRMIERSNNNLRVFERSNNNVRSSSRNYNNSSNNSDNSAIQRNRSTVERTTPSLRSSSSSSSSRSNTFSSPARSNSSNIPARSNSSDNSINRRGRR